MSRFTPEQYRAYQQRRSESLPANQSTWIDLRKGSEPRETKLHEEIIRFCNAKFPRWKYIHARTDVPSTIDPGAPDFTIAASDGRVFFIECKRGNAKLEPEQQAWAKELEMLGHKIHLVRHFDEFLEIVLKCGSR